jgi:hypothetical protein
MSYIQRDAASERLQRLPSFHIHKMSTNLSANELFNVNGMVAVITGGGTGNPLTLDLTANL